MFEALLVALWRRATMFEALPVDYSENYAALRTFRLGGATVWECRLLTLR